MFNHESHLDSYIPTKTNWEPPRMEMEGRILHVYLKNDVPILIAQTIGRQK